MNTEEENAREEFISDLYSEFANDVLAGRDELFGQVIDRFAKDRLRSFYLDNRRHKGIAWRLRSRSDLRVACSTVGDGWRGGGRCRDPSFRT
jgi:hypothetical protein